VILGPYDMLYRLSEKIKLRKRLTDAFGKYRGEMLLALGLLTAADDYDIGSIEDALSYTSLPVQFYLPGQEEIIDFISVIGGSRDMPAFCSSFIDGDTVMYILDPRDDRSKNGRTSLRNPLCMVQSKKTGFPVMTIPFPHRISDMDTIEQIIRGLKGMSSKNITLVADEGFYCSSNIGSLGTLGDSVLKLVIREEEYHRRKNRGEITSYKKNIESNEYLHRITEELKIHRYAYNDRYFFDDAPGHERLPNSKHDFYIEAVIGAIYLDKGLEYCRCWINSHVICDQVNIRTSD